jgi:hypothetical protein
MRTPSEDSIKAKQGRFYLVRQSNYNGGTTERVVWQVCEKLKPEASDSLWRLDREYSRKSDAMDWLQTVARF